MSESKKYTKAQRVMALIAIILLVSLSVAALVCSLLPIEGAARLSFAFLFAAVFMPILLWIWIWLYGKVTRKRTIASIKTSNETKEETEESEESNEESLIELDE